MDTRTFLDIGVGDRTMRMLVSAMESFRPGRLSFLKIPGEKRETRKQDGCDCPSLSVFVFLYVWTPFRICCLSLSIVTV